MTTTVTTTALDGNNEERIKSIQRSLRAWNVEKQSLEMEAAGIIQELTTSANPGVPPAGVDAPLVDAEGYPRADVDLYRVRELRGRLAAIRTDLGGLQGDLSTNLELLAGLQNSNKRREIDAENAARRAPKPKPKYDPVTKKWVVPSWDGTLSGVVPGGEGRRFESVGGESSSSADAEGATAIAGASLKNNLAAASSQASGTTPHGSSSLAAQSLGPTAIPRPPASSSSVRNYPNVPFALIDDVSRGSPAESAGLLEGDLVLAVNNDIDVHSNWQEALKELIPVAASRQETVNMLIRRGGSGSGSSLASAANSSAAVQREHTQQSSDDVMTILLKPRPWTGRGLLGCHIVPYHQS